MRASKNYLAIKNFIHNDLGVSKELIVGIIKEEMHESIKEVIRNTYGRNDLESIIRNILIQELGIRGRDVSYAMSRIVENKIKDLVEKEFTVSLVRKVINSGDERTDSM